VGEAMARLKGKRLWLLIGAGVVVVLVVAVVVTLPLLGRYTGAAAPEQFDRKVALDPSLKPQYQHVLGVAHNAGNNLETEVRALRSGAGVIEIDVKSGNGQLAAGRDQWWPWLAERVFLGPALVQAWDEASPAQITKLDLKQSNTPFLNDLVQFLNNRAPSRHVMVATRDASALMYLHRRLHRVTLLYSVAFPDAVHRLESDRALQKAIGGVSVYQGLVDPGLVHWVHEHNMQMIAWTVNEDPHFNNLVRLGVDGITTDNLAILKALRQ
jgi:hypothetical protein